MADYLGNTQKSGNSYYYRISLLYMLNQEELEVRHQEQVKVRQMSQLVEN